MSNAILPTLPGLTFPVNRTPMWSTKVQTSISGKETRLGLWSYPIWQYDVGYDLLRSDSVNLELQTLANFYNARQGSFDDWLFNDPDDNTAALAPFGIGDGTTTVFQLARPLVTAGVTEPVRAVNTITQVRKAGVATGAYTLNSNTGVITFTTAPAAGNVLDWSGTFYWRCRFMDDTFNLSKFMNTFWEAKSLKFQTCK
jgi:uncharacterized protein (TIGR02217 family)